MIDAGTKAGARALERLEHEVIGWLTTARPGGPPQSSPVWFLWDGAEILVYSLARVPRVTNITAHPLVSFHLDSDGRGGDIVTLEGEAHVDPTAPAPKDHEGYMAKYRPLLDDYGWTPEYFSAEYPTPIRIAVTRARLG